MKKTLFIALILIPFLCAAQQNPDFAARLAQNPGRYGQNNHTYEFTHLSDAKAPKGYKPFYISHYGRHGARSDWGGTQYARLRDNLQAAKDRGILSTSGDSLLWEAAEIARLHDGMNGRLTRKGCEEQSRLAERMYKRYRRVFRRGSRRVRCEASTVQRCIVSMAAFTNSLVRQDRKLGISMDTGERFYEYISNGMSDSLQAICKPWLDSLAATAVADADAVYGRLFTDTAAALELIPDAQQLCSDIFDTGREAEAFEIGRSLFRFLPAEYLYKKWENMNATAYIWNCNSAELGRDRLPDCDNLVEDIIRKADEAIAGDGPAADLRFGHDWPGLALAAYLGLEGVGDRMSFNEAVHNWPGFEYMPFSMNLQMVFYRNRKGGVLVKFLYNEKETLLRGLSPVSGPYYDWNTVKENIKGYLR